MNKQELERAIELLNRYFHVNPEAGCFLSPAWGP